MKFSKRILFHPSVESIFRNTNYLKPLTTFASSSSSGARLLATTPERRSWVLQVGELPRYKASSQLKGISAQPPQGVWSVSSKLCLLSKMHVFQWFFNAKTLISKRMGCVVFPNLPICFQDAFFSLLRH